MTLFSDERFDTRS